ncbi:MAG: mechanosensitive ion channel family protein [Clostridiaceae bacterium]|nr:mechanosensitive ion channel family protein [Clostridiaceae bacterium]
MSVDFLEEKARFILYKALVVLSIVIIMFLTIKIGCLIISKFVEKQNNLRYSLNIGKAKTLGAVLGSILRYFVYFFGIVAIFTECFGTISLTFAGIGGVAVGFGAQNLIKDIINGFFILFEDHFTVGDYIEIQGKSGVVESVELRVTKIKGLNGDLHIIPNGLITTVTNHSRGAIGMLVAVDLPHSEDMDKAIDIINEVCKKLADGCWDVIEGPTVLGISDLKENFYTIKVAGKVKPMTQWENENKLRLEIKRALDKAGIRLAYSKTEFVKDVQNGQEL